VRNRDFFLGLLVAGAVAVGGAGPGAASAGELSLAGASASPRVCDERPFLAQNSSAMARMMAGMDMKPTGDVDADFTAMMIPHHQGAIDMAIAELRYGKNEQLRRISQEIIVDQQQEIVAMRAAVGQPLPASAPAPTQAPAPSPTPPGGCPAPTDRSMSPSMPMQ